MEMIFDRSSILLGAWSVSKHWASRHNGKCAREDRGGRVKNVIKDEKFVDLDKNVQSKTEMKNKCCLIVWSFARSIICIFVFLRYVFEMHWSFRSRDWLLDLEFVCSRVCLWRLFFCDLRDVCARSFVSCIWLCIRLFSVIWIEIRRFVTCRNLSSSRSEDPSSSYFIDGVCSCLCPRRWRVSLEQRHVICRHPAHNVIHVWDVTSVSAIHKHLYFK